MFAVLKLDDFVPKDHPLRPIRAWLNESLKGMDNVFMRMYETVETARECGHLSGEHFSADGTLIQAWAAHKSFVPLIGARVTCTTSRCPSSIYCNMDTAARLCS